MNKFQVGETVRTLLTDYEDGGMPVPSGTVSRVFSVRCGTSDCPQYRLESSLTLWYNEGSLEAVTLPTGNPCGEIPIRPREMTVCPDCNGSGVITLLRTTVPCDCMK